MDDWDDEDEVEVLIEPREEALQRHGISPEAFEEALADAIDAYHEKIERLGEADETPTVGEMPVRIGDRSFRLDELADVHISDEEE